MSKLDRTDGGLLTLGIIGALAAAGSLRRGSAGKEVKRKPRDPRTDPKLPGTHEGSECPECGGMGHTIGFEGRRKVRHPCETCPPAPRGSRARDHQKTKRVLVNELVQQIQSRHPEMSERAIRDKARQSTKRELVEALETLRSDDLVVIPPMASWRGQVGSANYDWQNDWKAIQQAYKQEEEEGWAERGWEELQGQAIRKRLGPDIGLGADWSVSAWHIGPGDYLTDERIIGLVNTHHMANSRGQHSIRDDARKRLEAQGIDPQKYSRHGVNIEGGQFYLLDNEDDTYSVVQRFYVDDDYAGISAQDRRDYADGHNDAIVEIASFDEYPAFSQMMRWLDANIPKRQKGK